MQKRYAVQVKWALEQTEAALAPLAAKAMGIAPGQIEAVEITKQSIDARKGGVCFQVALAVSVRRGVKARPDWKPIEEKKAPAFALGIKRMQNSPVVIGAGPCGLFAALMLAEAGVCAGGAGTWEVPWHSGSAPSKRFLTAARLIRNATYCLGTAARGRFLMAS